MALAAPNSTLNPAQQAMLDALGASASDRPVLETLQACPFPGRGSCFARTKGLDTLPHLRAIGQQINARLLDIERVTDEVVPGPSFFERLQRPTWSPTGQRVSALRFGDPEPKDGLSIVGRKKTKLGALAANRDVEELAR